MVHHWSLFVANCLVLLILPNLDNRLVVRKMHHLLYFGRSIEGITEGTMLVPFEVLIKYSSLGISETVSEEDKNGSLLVLKYSSKNGDKLWTAVDYPGSIFDGIRVYNSVRNSEELLVEFPYGGIFGAIESIIIGLTEYSKLGEELGYKEGVWLRVTKWNIEGIIKGTMLGCVEGLI